MLTIKVVATNSKFVTNFTSTPITAAFSFPISSKFIGRAKTNIITKLGTTPNSIGSCEIENMERSPINQNKMCLISLLMLKEIRNMITAPQKALVITPANNNESLLIIIRPEEISRRRARVIMLPAKAAIETPGKGESPTIIAKIAPIAEPPALIYACSLLLRAHV